MLNFEEFFSPPRALAELLPPLVNAPLGKPRTKRA